MAKPNYSYEKRQRELEKKRKKEEKALRKASGGGVSADGTDAVQEEPDSTPEPGSPTSGAQTEGTA